MFHKSSVKLTGLYLAILMAISLFFSLNIYSLSIQEFDRGLRRPDPAFDITHNKDFPVRIRNQLHDLRQQQFEDARDHIMTRLMIINACIFVGGGILSYFLAIRTLRPIEEAHESLERFTADASHELRTPITAMQTELEVALMNPKLTLSQAKENMKSNLEELSNLTRLTEDLLRLARLENSDHSIATTNIQTILKQAADQISAAAKAKNISVNLPADSKMEVTGDAATLREAFLILFDNAIKYSPEKSKVQVELTHNNNEVLVKIIDQGIGMKASELVHIFDRFYRTDSARTKQNGKGYGLGLAIAKNIIENHHGLLSVTSKPEKGSTFIVQLPLKT